MEAMVETSLSSPVTVQKVDFQTAMNLLKLIKQKKTPVELGGIIWALEEGKVSREYCLELAEEYFKSNGHAENGCEKSIAQIVSEKFLQFKEIIAEQVDDYKKWHKEVTSFAYQFRKGLNELASQNNSDFPGLKCLLSLCNTRTNTAELVDNWRLATNSNKKNFEDEIVGIVDRNQRIIRQPNVINQARKFIEMHNTKEELSQNNAAKEAELVQFLEKNQKLSVKCETQEKEIEFSKTDINEMVEYATKGVETIKSLKERLDEQTLKATKLQNEVQVLSGEKKHLEASKRALEQANSKQNKNLAAIQKQYQEFGITSRNFEQEKNKVAGRISDLEKLVETTKTNLQKAGEEKATLQNKLSSAEKQLQTSSQQLETLRELYAIQLQSKEDPEKTAELKRQIGEYESAVKGLERQLKENREQLTTLEQRLGEEKSRAEKFRSDCTSLKSEYNKIVGEKETLQESNSQFATALSEKENHAKQKDGELKKLEGIVSRFETENAELGNENKTLNEKIEAYQKDLSQRSDELQQRIEAANELNGKYNSIIGQIEKVKEEIGAKAAEILQKNERIQILGTSVEQLNKQLSQQDNTHKQELEKLTQSYSSEMSKLMGERGKLESEMKNSGQRIIALESERSDYETKLGRIGKELAGKINECSALQNSVEATRKELEAKQGKLAVANESIAKLGQHIAKGSKKYAENLGLLDIRIKKLRDERYTLLCEIEDARRKANEYESEAGKTALAAHSELAKLSWELGELKNKYVQEKKLSESHLEKISNLEQTAKGSAAKNAKLEETVAAQTEAIKANKNYITALEQAHQKSQLNCKSAEDELKNAKGALAGEQIYSGTLEAQLQGSEMKLVDSQKESEEEKNKYEQVNKEAVAKLSKKDELIAQKDAEIARLTALLNKQRELESAQTPKVEAKPEKLEMQTEMAIMPKAEKMETKELTDKVQSRYDVSGNITKLLEKGKKQYNQMSYKKALDTFKQALHASETADERMLSCAWLERGYTGIGKPWQAIAMARSAMKMCDAGDYELKAALYRNLGLAKHDAGEHFEAIKTIARGKKYEAAADLASCKPWKKPAVKAA